MVIYNFIVGNVEKLNKQEDDCINFVELYLLHLPIKIIIMKHVPIFT